MADGGLVVRVMGSGTSAGVPMIGCACATCLSADSRDKRTRPSIVVSYADGAGEMHNILVDTTPELRLQAVREGLKRISAIVYTHAHADHIFGLDDVRRFNTLMGAPIPVYAAEEALTSIRRCFPYAFEAPLPPDRPHKDAIYRPELLARMIEGDFELFGREWKTMWLPHGRFRTLGFRVGDFAYCTDCNDVPAEAREKLRGLDVLIIDALRPRPHPAHLSFEQALGIIEDLKPRRAFFTHLSHDMRHEDIEKTLPAHVRVGYDGLKINIP